MRNVLRVTLLVVSGAILVKSILWVGGSWRRFKERQFPEGEACPTGWLARAYARTAPWAGSWLYAIFARRLDLQPEDEVLDVACGSGAFLRKYASHTRRVAGLDHSQDLIDIALEQNQERVAAGTAEFVVGDATVLPWADGQFTVVTCNCLDCFAKKAAEALQEMYRVLKPGGRALMADDRCEDMEAAGFTDVSAERLLWGYLTSGSKS